MDGGDDVTAYQLETSDPLNLTGEAMACLDSTTLYNVQGSPLSGGRATHRAAGSSVLNQGFLGHEEPVDPKPPSPRSVSGKESASIQKAVGTLTSMH